MKNLATKLATVADRLENNPEIRGFYFTWLSKSADSRIEIEQAPIGEVKSPYKNPNIQACSLEKAMRLAAHYMRAPKEAISSFQTADKSSHKYPGSVLFPGLEGTFDVFSVSAYQALRDEAVAAIFGRELKFGDQEHVDKILLLSQNPFYRDLDHGFSVLKTLT